MMIQAALFKMWWRKYRSLFLGVKTENLIKSTCFYLKDDHLKSSRVHVFFSKFSQVHMFDDEYCSKLVPKSTQTGGFPSWMIVNNITKNQNVEI